MSYRTNRRTRGIFRVSTTRLGRIVPRARFIPAETKFFRDVAKASGLRTRIEIRDIDTLHTRGFPDTETSEISEARKEYIRENIDTIPFMAINGETGDIIDGNHRWVTFKEQDIKRAPVLAVYGIPRTDLEENPFEDFIQHYNSTAGYESVLPKKYGRLPHEQ